MTLVSATLVASVVLVAALAPFIGFARAAETPESGPPGSLDPAPAPPAVIAHWRFDEAAGTACLDASGHGYDAAPEAGRGEVNRVPGIFGRA